ncbi:low temperature requirement protein LtrA, partial [Saprolegnia diclina VS20]
MPRSPRMLRKAQGVSSRVLRRFLRDGNHPFHTRMTGRDPKELHRTSTSLEKLYDLTLVVALSSVSNVFATSMQYGDKIAFNCMQFVMLFFTIWNAWLPFIWFSSTYDVDDVLYRVGTLGQMIGILVISDGIHNNLSEVFIGYVILRLFLEVFLRGRAAYEDPRCRIVNLRSSIASLLLLVGWGFLFHTPMPEAWFYIGYMSLATLEFVVPGIVAKVSGGAPAFHAHHVSERYAEFTIIVFGECLLSLSHASVIESTSFHYSAFAILVASMVLLFLLWWFYFAIPFGHKMELHPATSGRIGRGHFFIHGSLAAFATGLFMVARCVSAGSDHGDETVAPMSTQAASMMVAVPVAVFVVTVPLVFGLGKADVARSVLVAAIEVVLGWFLTPILRLELMMLLYILPMLGLLVHVIAHGHHHSKPPLETKEAHAVQPLPTSALAS